MQAPLTTVDKAIDVLFQLHGSASPLGVTELAEALGGPKSTTHRLLAALRHRGLVEQDEAGRYRTGVALIALGSGVQDREPVVLAARPLLQEEARALGETAFLVAARAGRLLVLDKAEGTGFLRAAPQVGEVVPVHATAVGKLQLAFAPHEVDFEPHVASSFTPATLTAERALAEQVALAAAQGWAANEDEWVEGLSVLAAPVFHRERLMAQVALAAPSPRVRVLGLEHLAQRVRALAARICKRLDGGDA